MASYTTNLNLKKPSGSENVAISDINGNMDTIDSAVGALQDRFGNYSETAITSLDSVPVNTTGYNLFTGGAHPAGGDGGSLCYWCYGVSARRVIIATAMATGNTWINTRNNSSTWTGWKKITTTSV